MHYLETYNASEGFFAVQHSPDTPGMMLLTDAGVFYEFVPLGAPLTPKPFPHGSPPPHPHPLKGPAAVDPTGYGATRSATS